MPHFADFERYQKPFLLYSWAVASLFGAEQVRAWREPKPSSSAQHHALYDLSRAGLPRISLTRSRR
jgi:hypothetical protein